MRPALFLIACLLFHNCNSKQEQTKKQVPGPQAAVRSIINYDSCKKSIALTKQQLQKKWLHMSKTAKEKIFTAAIAETIAPAWIGTTWNFYGTTETPQKGSIACGYFVTTVLRDAGLPVARVKLAQCASEQMICSLVQSKYISRFSNTALEDFMLSVKKLGYGLYIVGLDNHTGFIYHDGTGIYFIHSTFLGTRNVQKENAATSGILKQSKYKVLGKISSDEQVLERWIH